MKIGSLEIELLANMARLQKDMDQAKSTVSGAMRSIERSAEAAKGAIVGIASGLSIGAFASMVKASIDAADKLGDLSKSTNLTVEQLAGLDLAARQSGADLDSVARGVNRLSVEMGKNAEKFAAVGISAKDPIEALKQVADIYAAIEDPQQKAAFGAAALGKEWAQLAPLLAEGGAKIGEMTEEGARLSGVTQGMVEESDKFNDQLAKIQLSISGVATRVGGDLLPLLNALVSEMVEAGEKANGMGSSFNPLTETLRALAIVGGNVTFVFKAIGTEIGGISAQLAALASGDFKAFSAIGDMMKADAAAARAEFDAWEQRILNAGKGVTSSPGEPTAKKGAAPSGVAGFIAGGKTGGSAANKAEKEAYESALKYAQERAKLRNDEYDAINDYLQSEEAARVASVKAANDAVKAAQDEYDQYGMTRSQIEEITLARMRDKLAGVDSSSAIAQSLEQEIAAQEKLIGIMRKGEDRDAKIKEQEKEAAEAQKIWDNFTENVQRNMGDGFYDAMNGNFRNIGDAFKSMVQRMLADAMAANLMKALTGGGASSGGGYGGILGSVVSAFSGGWGSWGASNAGFAASNGMSLGELAASFDGGGFTGNGPRSGGIDGIGGFPAILHPQETVIDHSKGQSAPSNTVQVTYAPTIQIDSRTDQAEVRSIVDRAVKNGNAQLVDQLQRAGRI